MTALTPDEFASLANVSRETLDRLTIYLDRLRHWQARINLVADSSLDDPWRRHFLDSAQLYPHIQPAGALLDLGSGAGFPGLVLAILGASDVTLIESNGKKCAFLRDVARATETEVAIFADRVEAYHGRHVASTITARALAPLEKLLVLATPLLAPHGVCLFLKGARVEEELTAVEKRWQMTIERIRSVSDDQATILKIRGLESAHDT